MMVTDIDPAERKPPEDRSYFFLSYAHSPPLEGDGQKDHDKDVREFFHDLTDAVTSRASPHSGIIRGSFDQDFPVGPDWLHYFSRALGAAEVFVPLYSPGYFARSWPGREWACFYQRMVIADLEDPVRRFAPVLWTPLQAQHNLPGLRAAMEIGAAEPEYEKSGLRALLRIEPYRDLYRAAENKLAERVVALAEGSPLAPSAVPDIDEIKSAFQPEARLAVFAVAVAAPIFRAVPAGSDPGCYADNSIRWQPFPGQEFLLAEYVQGVAERLAFEVEFTSPEDACDPVVGRPGIILIDPWFIVDDEGSALRSVLRKLPPWVLPLVVLGSPHDKRACRLAEQVRDMLSPAGAPPVESSRRAGRCVSSPEEFAAALPALIAEAERRYLRHANGLVPLGLPGGRPRLSGAAQWDTPASAPDSAGETPD